MAVCHFLSHIVSSKLIFSANEVHLVCLLADAENISFEETVRDKKWQTAMDEEIKAIDRKNTWELTEKKWKLKAR